MIDKFSILNGLKYLYSGILQNFFVFISAEKDFSDTTRIDHGNLLEFQKKIFKIKLNQAAILHKLSLSSCITRQNFNWHC